MIRCYFSNERLIKKSKSNYRIIIWKCQPDKNIPRQSNAGNKL